MKLRYGLMASWVWVLVWVAACGQAPGLSKKAAFLSANTDRLDFSEVEVGSRAELPVFLINQGEEELRIGEIEGDSVGGAFTLTIDGSTIAPNDEVTAHVNFVPQQERAYATVFIINNDSLNESSFHLTLMGIGVVPDPCLDKVCDDPPPPACLGASLSRVFDPAGVCGDDGECDYEAYTESCNFGCLQESGLCSPDPCIGVVCDEPPNGCYHALGSCTDGRCSYNPNNGASCEDGNPCTIGDACLEGGCRGQPKPCNEPPAAQCPDTDTRQYWDTQGVCNPDDGLCLYAEHALTCEYGCLDGQCQGNPCAGVVCDSPPTACHAQVGTCDAGACTYGFDDDAGCTDNDLCTYDDSCRGGVCRGSQVVCATPPDPVCDDPEHVRQYAGIGTCSSDDGECDYTPELVFCTHGCVDGACRNEPQFGSDVLTVQYFYTPENHLLSVDARDVDLSLANPLNQICDWAHASPNWGDYGTAAWSGVGISEETILHSVNNTDLADGTYLIETTLYNDCSEYACVVICACVARASVPYTVELRINNVRAMSCAHTFPQGDTGETVEIATITRVDGYLQAPVSSGTIGVVCTLY